MRSQLRVVDAPTFPSPEGVAPPPWSTRTDAWFWSPLGGAWMRGNEREFRFDDGVGFTLDVTQACAVPGQVMTLFAHLTDVTLDAAVSPADLRELGRWFGKAARILDHAARQ